MPSEVSTVSDDQSVEEPRRELAEAREQQAATAEILRVISSSPMDLQRVFAEIATSAARLCDAYDAVILQRDGDMLRPVGHFGPIPVPDALPLVRGTVMGRAILELRMLQVADLQAEGDDYPEGSNLAHRLGFRTQLAVPLMRTGEAKGVIAIRRSEVRPFSDRQVGLLKTFADQAVIAIENARLFESEQTRTKELREALEYQTAISDVLGTIGRSKFDLQPVLDTITSTASRLCSARDAAILLREGANLRVAARRVHPDYTNILIGRDSVAGRTVLDRVPVHVHDLSAASDEFRLGRQRAARFGHRTTLGIPLLRQGEAIGCLVLWRIEMRPFTERQIDLLTTFADQAVIAIENTRLFEAEQASKRELAEALEYQTATSDVLSVISRSPNELQPVLEAIVETARRLCQSDRAIFFQLRDGYYHLAAERGTDPEFLGWLRDNPMSPELGSGSTAGRAARERRTIHVPDMVDDPEYNESAIQRRGRARSRLAVPLLRDDVVFGVILVARDAVRPFTDRQIKLVETFADQAVIAIENARLFEEVQTRTKELQGSLDWQTATSEVLGVISRSPNEVRPVLDTIVATAHRLCQAERAVIWRLEGETFRAVAHHGLPQERGESVLRVRMPLSRGSMVGRATLARRAVQVEDVAADPELAAAHAFNRAGNVHTSLAVPLLLKGEPIGVITLTRTRVALFDDKQVALVESFADQAVIAIENSRLFEAEQASKRELARSVEELESLAKVSQAVNSSLELDKVLPTILEHACAMSYAGGGTVYVVDKTTGEFRLAAAHNMSDEHIAMVRAQPMRLNSAVVGDCATRREVVQVADLSSTTPSPLIDILLRTGVRAVLAGPLLATA